MLENNEWFGVSRHDETNSTDKEWPESYHGTQKGFAESIITDEGYVLRTIRTAPHYFHLYAFRISKY